MSSAKAPSTSQADRYFPATGIVLAITHEDKPYLPRLSPALGGIKSKVFTGKIDTLASFVLPLKRAGVKHIATTRLDILIRLLPQGQVKKPSINNYACSIILHDDIEFLILNPLKQLISKSFGDFLCRRYLSKFVRPQKWRQATEFDWSLVDSARSYADAKKFLESCDLIAVDIETVRKDVAIKCIGYCGFNLQTGESHAYVIPMTSMLAVIQMRELNSLPVPKVLQNGKYDCAYLARYNAPLASYYYDTINMMHSWFAEMPKDLGFATAFLVRDSMYWKDLSATGDLME